jgi:hypothetical protein
MSGREILRQRRLSIRRLPIKRNAALEKPGAAFPL